MITSLGKLILLVASFIFLFMIIPLSAHAQYTFYIDEFSVDKNGNPMFFDSFDDGMPPPNAPNFEGGNPAEYLMSGTMGPETGGKLTLDSSGVISVTTPGGDPFFHQRARLRTNINESDLALGLKIDDTFSVTGIFDLIAPPVPKDAYGVRFNDFTSTNTGNDIVEVVVRRTPNNNLTVQFRELDFVLGTVTTIESVPLEMTHDQIWLNLMRDDVSSNAITASIAYIDGGVMGTVMTSPNTIDIFDGENFTRAEFIARTVVPEPISSTLFIVGGATLGYRQWRRKRRTALI